MELFFSDGWGRCNGFDILQATTYVHHTAQTAPRLRHLRNLAIRTVCISDSELGDGAHLAGDPSCEDLPTLLFAQARAWEVTLCDEGDNVGHELMLVENGVNDDGDYGGKVGFSNDLDEYNDEAASLENGAG